ncbi:GNAT family N-acetyltransferase [Brevundimonas variabilis]|uniref:Putative acetyltransferase n=1 Tax=Brevundimonas variabilis TaxID=74312 RepID=A0A7W9FEP0_9CAUL|nr:putative acetyltransferase [Brevundimonas variabilis]
MADASPVEANFADPTFLELVDLHLSAMREHSPPDSVHALGASGLAEDGTSAFVILQDGRAVSMGALRQVDEGTFEIKSMRTHPHHLGQGHGRSMLEHLIARAAALSARRVSLETGSGLAFEPALALYRSRGFVPGPAFGNYEATAFNQFLHLDLTPDTEFPA